MIDGLGQPLDDRGPIKSTHNVSINGEYINPFDRGEISTVLNVGIKSINALTLLAAGEQLVMQCFIAPLPHSLPHPLPHSLTGN